jgi:hypothetical protein
VGETVDKGVGAKGVFVAIIFVFTTTGVFVASELVQETSAKSAKRLNILFRISWNDLIQLLRLRSTQRDDTRSLLASS